MEKDNFKNLNFGHHSQKRIQQRTNMKNINIIITFADRVIPVKNGCLSLSLSKDKIKSVVKEGHVNVQTADKISNLAAIVANDNVKTDVVTVVRMKDDIRGRHYRKNIKIRYKSKSKKHNNRRN